MRRGLVVACVVGLWFAACGGDSSSGDRGGGGGAGAAGAPGGGGTGGSGGSGGGATGTGGADGGAAGTSAGEELAACDITAPADSCLAGSICAGTPSSGYYCRQVGECSVASPGDSCGENGVCLEAGTPGEDDDPLACFELDACDFLTSAGCDTAAGESCVVVDFEPLRTVCAPAGSRQAGERCDAAAQNQCAAGLACLGSDLEDGDLGVCTPLCRPGEPLPDDCVECIALTAELGSCAECSVLDDDCGAQEHCYPISEALGGVCVGWGNGTVGEECTFQPPESCQQGHLCMEWEDVPGPDRMRCVQICDLAAPQCTDPTQICNDVGVFEAAFETGKLALCTDLPVQFCWPSRGVLCSGSADCIGAADDQPGMCLPPCDPTLGEAACQDNFACLPAVDGVPFFDAFLRGNGVCGTGCSTDGQCGSGNTCLHLDGLDTDGVCGPTCDPSGQAPCGDSASCVPTPEDAAVGACVPDLGLCDPSAADSCDPPGACTALDGSSTEGACLFACHVQNPDACDFMANDCLEKGAEQWHSGICIGMPTPCDPVAQTGCDAGENCAVLGGSAFGGYAFICEDAGAALETEDCSGEDVDCADGLLCISGVCRRPCDPGNDQCRTGTCEDVSEQYYLPSGSVGACSTE